MDYNKIVLKNGLRVITVSMPQVESVTSMILVGAGSRYESKKTNGISHFLEHMVFKGTQKRPSALAISSVIDGIGADFNAATGKEETLFFIKSAQKHLSLSLDILTDIVLHSKISAEETEREKGVIIEEINMYEDTPMRRVNEYFEKLLYPDSSLGWDIAGDKETIKGIKRKDFLEYHHRLYFPENMVVIVAGGFKERQAQSLVEDYFIDLKSKIKKPVSARQFTQTKPEVFLKTKKTDQTHLVLGVRGNPLGHKDRYIEAILATILGGGMSSRLFIQVRERRGLAYYIRTEVEHYLDNGYLATAAGVDTKRAKKAIEVILEEYQKMSKLSQISQKELNKAKEFVKGRLILDLEDSRNVASLYGTQELLEGEIRTPKEMMAQIDKVTKEDVTRVAGEFFANQRLNLAIVGPFKEKDGFEKILKF